LNEVLVVGLGRAAAVTDAEPARVVVLIALDELGDEELAVAVADERFGGAAHEVTSVRVSVPVLVVAGGVSRYLIGVFSFPFAVISVIGVVSPIPAIRSAGWQVERDKLFGLKETVHALLVFFAAKLGDDPALFAFSFFVGPVLE
jgi:hypothetical protein